MTAKSSKSKSSIGSPVRTIAVALFIFAFIKIFAIDILLVDGHSMEPAYGPGHIIFVNRLAFGFLVPFSDIYLFMWSMPSRGEAVILESPMDNSKIVKRCAALPGDTLSLSGTSLVIDHNKSFEIESEAPFFMKEGETTVPLKKIVVLGDNAGDSIDSRMFGFVSVDRVLGSVLF
jgi:signal peptidase I